MGYGIYSVGERVRITSGQFAGVVGVVDPPDSARGAIGKVILSGGKSELKPVNVATAIDGYPLTLKVPPRTVGAARLGQFELAPAAASLGRAFARVHFPRDECATDLPPAKIQFLVGAPLAMAEALAMANAINNQRRHDGDDQ